MSLADVTAHEFFHLWNVKRIRPQSLEPIDYQAEMDTRALWFSEGVTSTVGDLMLVARGNRSTSGSILTGICGTRSRNCRAGRRTSGSRRKSRAWTLGLKAMPFYRSPERSISYYNKGEILGILLDLRIRQLTKGNKSLRDLFAVDERTLRQAASLFSRFPRGRGSGGDSYRPELRCSSFTITCPA